LRGESNEPSKILIDKRIEFWENMNLVKENRKLAKREFKVT